MATIKPVPMLKPITSLFCVLLLPCCFSSYIYIKKKREICAVISGDKAKFVGREIFSLAVYAAP
jgi:hypothetical protein